MNNLILTGIVGSTAYGLNTPDSDVDRLGVFAVPTETLFGLYGLKAGCESVVSKKPDATYHEAAKACRLMLGGNPTVSEILWLPDDLYETRTPLGDELIGIREAFLSAGRVKAAYLGYAAQQFRKLEARGDGSFSADTRKRTAKHARHLMRLCWQGYHLYRTGKLLIQLDDPQRFHNLGQRVANGDIDAARLTLAHCEAAMDNARLSALPDEPDTATVEDWLLRVRKAYL